MKSHGPRSESALDSILVAFPFGKPVSTFPGNALNKRDRRRSDHLRDFAFSHHVGREAVGERADRATGRQICGRFDERSVSGLGRRSIL